MAVTISQALTTTLFNQKEKTANQILKSNAVLSEIEKRGKVKVIPGGYEYRTPNMYQQTGNGKWFSGLEELDGTIVDDATVFQFAIKQAAEVIGISGRDKRANQGSKEQMINLLVSKKEAGISRLKNTINTSIHSDGTGSGGKELDGLLKAVNVSPTSGTYGGIDRSAETWARNAVNTGNTLSAANVQAAITAGYLKIVRGSEKPHIGVCDNTAWGHLHSSLTSMQRIVSDKDTGAAGFGALEFMGIKFVLDGGYGGAAASNTIRLLNMDYWELVVQRGAYFEPLGDARMPVLQDAEFTILLFEGNLACNAPAFQCVIN